MDDPKEKDGAPSGVKGVAALVLLQLAAFWPVWTWCVSRARMTPEGCWGLLPLGVLSLLLWRRRREARAPKLGVPSLLLIAYAIAYAFVPPIVRAALAAACVASLVSLFYRGKPLDLAVLGLLLVSLPAVFTLQTYFGFRLRLLSTELAAPLLRLSGFPVVADGTCLDWGDRRILVDAPCSGIKMLWAGVFLAFALAAFLRLRNLRCMLAVSCAVAAVFLGNVLRTAALFYLEAGVVRAPSWAHDGCGGVAFALAAGAICGIAYLLGKERSCVPRSSTSFVAP